MKTLKDKIQEYDNWLNHIRRVITKTDNALRLLELKAQEQILEVVVRELKLIEDK